MAGYSQERLAERAGLSVGAIAALEQGLRRAPHRDTVDAISDALTMSESTRKQFEGAAARARRRQRRDDSNLPASLTSFIERNEVDELQALLGEHRLVTITGSGGVGKTRVALEVARRTEHRYDETCFVDLLPIRDGGLIGARIAARLNVQARGDDGLSEIVHHLRSRRALLVIDNCEHLVADAAAVVGTLLQGCPSLTVLATSRETLALSPELSYRLPCMDAKAASELFVARAQASDRTWTVDARGLAIVAEICNELDGIPLAIELAASRATMLGLAALRSRLAGGLSFTGNRDLPLRHQTMTATIAWSHDLLSDPERLLFRRSSIVMGSFALQWAEEVCIDNALPVGKIADTLSRLVQKCLINVEHAGNSTRYHFLESIRTFAQQRLSECGEFDRTMLRGLTWLEQKAAALLERPSTEAIMAHRDELDNVRAAVRWAVSSEDQSHIVAAANILIGFARVYSWSTRQSEARILGLDVIERLNEDQDPELIGELICSFTTMITAAERMALAPRAIPLLKQSGKLDRAAFLHAKLAEIECNRGNADAAREHVAEAEALLSTGQFRHSRSGRVTAMTCAYVCSLLSDFDTARRLLAQTDIPVGDPQEVEAQIVLAEMEFRERRIKEASRISERARSSLDSYPAVDHLTIMVFGNHARYLLYLEAESAAEEALRVSLNRVLEIRDSGFLYVTASLARHAATHAARAGRPDLAARIQGACDATDERNGRPSVKDDRAEDLAAASLSAQLSGERVAMLRARGAEEDLYELLEEYFASPAAEDSARTSAMSSSRATSVMLSSPN